MRMNKTKNNTPAPKKPMSREARRRMGTVMGLTVVLLLFYFTVSSLAETGQIATQYVDLDGNPTMDVDFNPNGSVWAIEGILSPDGRILGKMGHAERIGPALYRNVPGDYDLRLFEAAKDYFSI